MHQHRGSRAGAGRGRTAWRARAAAAVTAASLASAGSVLTAPAALAHDDEGRLTLVEVREAGAGLEVTVELRHSGDGHPAVDAAVTVAGDGPHGAVLQPVLLEPTGSDGVYRGAVDLAGEGEWELRVSSLGPVAQLRHTEVVGGADATATDATTVPATDPATDTPASTSTDTGPPSPPPAEDVSAPEVGTEAGTSGPPVGTAVVAALALGLGGLLLALRRRTAPVRSGTSGSDRSAGR